MAGVKISALPAIPSAALTDVGPFVQGTTTYKATLSQIVTLFNTNIQLASTAQVTGLTSALASFVPLAGGTMTGALILNTNSPTTALQAASKGYVDSVASGLTIILAAYAATTVNLNATPAGAGVGATLTNAGAMVAFAVDGVSPPVNSRILVKNQTLTQHNGIYDLTTVGSGAANWVLTRSTDYDTNTEIVPGSLVAVNNGTVNATTSWLETATVTTVDTDPVLFSQFTFAPTAFFQIANNLSEGVPATMRTNLGLTGAAVMTLPVSGTNGGTGINNGASTITIGGSVSFIGAFTFAGTLSGNTAVTFPTTGTLITSSQPTINQPNIVGVTNNSSAAAGSVGELISSVVLVGAAVSLTTGVSRDVTSIALTAGDWDITANAFLTRTGDVTAHSVWTSDTSATAPDAALVNQVNVGSALGNCGIPAPSIRYSLNVPTTIYLSVASIFTTGTVTACGGIYARRRR